MKTFSYITYLWHNIMNEHKALFFSVIVVVIIIIVRHKKLVLFQKGRHFLTNPSPDTKPGDHSEEHFEQTQSRLAFGLFQVGSGRTSHIASGICRHESPLNRGCKGHCRRNLAGVHWCTRWAWRRCTDNYCMLRIPPAAWGCRWGPPWPSASSEEQRGPAGQGHSASHILVLILGLDTPTAFPRLKQLCESMH